MPNVHRLKTRIPWMLAIFLLLSVGIPARGGAQPPFKVPAFGDPLDTQTMPPEWQAKPITHQRNVDLAVMLSYQLADLLEPAVKRFAEQQGVAVSIDKGTDGTALALLERKAADLVSFCDSPAKIDRMPGVQFHALGITPVVFFVHPATRISTLSIADVQRIYRGTLTNWSQLGGADLRIQPVARSHCKAHRGRFKPLENMDELTPRAIIVGSVEDALKFVAQTPGSIAYDMLVNPFPLHEQGQLKILSIEGQNPLEREVLRGGRYPYYRTFAVTTWQDRQLANPLAGKLLATLVAEVAAHERDFHIVPAGKLADAGWRFHGDELVGEPPLPAR